MEVYNGRTKKGTQLLRVCSKVRLLDSIMQFSEDNNASWYLTIGERDN